MQREKLLKSHKKYIYYESHHIIPKSCGGSDQDCNLVLLTPREHFIAHLLLTKFTEGVYKRSMYHAFHLMVIVGDYKINSRIFDSYKKNYSKQASEANRGKLHPMYGKKHSHSSRQKMSVSTSGKNNPMYGKTISDEHKKILSDQQKLRVGEKNSFYGGKHTPETKEFLSELRKGTTHTIKTKDKISLASSGINNPRFNGWYITPVGSFTSSLGGAYAIKNVSHTTIRRWCKNPKKIISILSYRSSLYLQNLGEEKMIVGKRFSELGFGFKSISPKT